GEMTRVALEVAPGVGVRAGGRCAAVAAVVARSAAMTKQANRARDFAELRIKSRRSVAHGQSHRYSDWISVSMHILRPLPRAITRPIALVVLVAWAATMATLVARSYGQSSQTNLATDLARYGSTAVWRGVYYRGEKIGFTVSQTTRTEDGFELQEEGRLQMLLLGQDTGARIRTTARVDTSFTLRSFDFSLDPGTGPVTVRGTVDRPTQDGG